MYYNFGRLSKTSLSIAFAIIAVILSILFFALGLKYEGSVVAGFILVALSFLFLSASCSITFVKCRKFGNENAYKKKPPKNFENNELFKKLTTLISIFSIVFFGMFVLGIILMLA